MVFLSKKKYTNHYTVVLLFFFMKPFNFSSWILFLLFYQIVVSLYPKKSPNFENLSTFSWGIELETRYVTLVTGIVFDLWGPSTWWLALLLFFVILSIWKWLNHWMADDLIQIVHLLWNLPCKWFQAPARVARQLDHKLMSWLYIMPSFIWFIIRALSYLSGVSAISLFSLSFLIKG